MQKNDDQKVLIEQLKKILQELGAQCLPTSNKGQTSAQAKDIIQKSQAKILKNEQRSEKMQQRYEKGVQINEKAQPNNVIPFKKQTLFKNGVLVSYGTGETQIVDILVDRNVIEDVLPRGKLKNFVGEVVDLQGDFVLPPFVNAFCDSARALEETYDLQILNTLTMNFNINDQKFFHDAAHNFVYTYMMVKNLCAGVINFNDLSLPLFDTESNTSILQDIAQKTEGELDELCLKVHQTKSPLFCRVGQTLDELGALDKQFHKPLSQVLEDFGFLDISPAIVGANCLEKDELELLKSYDCPIVLTPGDDAKAARRPNNLVLLKNLDFLTAIGSGHSFEVDFFAFMRQILMNTWGMFEDKSVLTEKDVLFMATTAGSVVLNTQIQRIEKGATANFIVVKRTNSLYEDPCKQIVWEKSKHDVRLTVWDGEIVQKNGEILMKNFLDCDTMKETIKLFTRRNQKNDD